jgi:hypothetical protein
LGRFGVVFGEIGGKLLFFDGQVVVKCVVNVVSGQACSESEDHATRSEFIFPGISGMVRRVEGGNRMVESGVSFF